MSLGTLVLLAGICLVAILFCLHRAILSNSKAIGSLIETEEKLVKATVLHDKSINANNEASRRMFAIIEELSDYSKLTTNHDKKINELFAIIKNTRQDLDKLNGVKPYDQQTT